MTCERRRGLAAAGHALLLGLLVAGCQGEIEGTVTPEGTIAQNRLNAVYRLYDIFRTKRNASPVDAEEINKFGLALPSNEGGPVQLTEEFLVSPRDKKPIIVRYGLDLSKSPPEGPLLAYEQDGWKGRRFVVYGKSGKIEEVEDAQFQELLK